MPALSMNLTCAIVDYLTTMTKQANIAAKCSRERLEIGCDGRDT